MRLSRIYQTLSTPEKDGSRIGLFRGICAILGGLVAAYAAMTLMVLLMPSQVRHKMIIPFMFTPFLWACAALWISLSPTRLGALLRWGIPSILFTTAILILV